MKWDGPVHWNVQVLVKCGSYHVGVVGGQRIVTLLVILVPQSCPPEAGWWHYPWAEVDPGRLACCGRSLQPDWRRAGGSLCGGRVGSAADNRHRRRRGRSLPQQMHL